MRRATVTPVVIGPFRRQGVRLELASAALVDPGFPGRWVVTHPAAPAERAAAEVQWRVARGGPRRVPRLVVRCSPGAGPVLPGRETLTGLLGGPSFLNACTVRATKLS